jgi:signal transduction histidine kinase
LNYEIVRRAHELHDALQQTLQGSKMVADNAREHINDPQQTARALDRLSEWLDRASAEGRALLAVIAPPDDPTP